MSIRLPFAAVALSLLAGAASAQQIATADFPAELRGQIEDTLKQSVLAPPATPQATCGTVAVGQEGKWAAPWKRGFSHHPSEWLFVKNYPAGTPLRFCQYSAKSTGTAAPEVAYTAEVVTLNPTAAQLAGWMTQACRTTIALNGASTAKFDQCVRGLYWGLPLQAASDKKTRPGIRQSSGGQFVVAGAVVQEQARGGIVCYRDGVAMLRDRPGLPMIGYFALTEQADGKLDKTVNDGELAECFKIAAPREWPGGSPAQVSATTRDQFWAALPKLGLSPGQYGLTVRSDLDPTEAWRRVVRESHLAALKGERNVMLDAWALANAGELLR
jgi:hypothetical protein